MKVKMFSFNNLLIEIVIGSLPMFIICLSNRGMSDFADQVSSYIPNRQIQWVFLCFFLFGLTVTIANTRFVFSKYLLRTSFSLFSTFISLFQMFGGILLFFSFYTLWHGAYPYTLVFAPHYYIIHFVTTNLSSFWETQVKKNSMCFENP
jgi:hypothetical protein